MRRFLLVGLTGSIATGKSTVSRMFAELGCIVIDADLLAREVVEPGAPALAEIAAEFGAGVLQPDGALDRKKLGAIVFGDPARRRRLEQITHPAIGARFLQQLADLEARGFDGIVLWDAPVMIESGGYKQMDTLVVVATDEATQATRLRARDLIDAAEAERKIRSQMPIAEKAKLADYVIDNAGDRDATLRQVREVHAALSAEAGVAKHLLVDHPSRRVAALGVVFPKDMGNRGQNRIALATVYGQLRMRGTQPDFIGYHRRPSGNFIFVRSDSESEPAATAAIMAVTKLESIARSFSALVHVSWHVPAGAKTTRGGSIILDDASGVWRLVVVFLSEAVRPEQRVTGQLTASVRLLTWPSHRDVLCAYDRPGEPGDVGQVTRAVEATIRKSTGSPTLFGSGRALGVVRDILYGKGLRSSPAPDRSG